MHTPCSGVSGTQLWGVVSSSCRESWSGNMSRNLWTGKSIASQQASPDGSHSFGLIARADQVCADVWEFGAPCAFMKMGVVAARLARPLSGCRFLVVRSACSCSAYRKNLRHAGSLTTTLVVPAGFTPRSCLASFSVGVCPLGVPGESQRTNQTCCNFNPERPPVLPFKAFKELFKIIDFPHVSQGPHGLGALDREASDIL